MTPFSMDLARHSPVDESSCWTNTRRTTLYKTSRYTRIGTWRNFAQPFSFGGILSIDTTTFAPHRGTRRYVFLNLPCGRLGCWIRTMRVSGGRTSAARWQTNHRKPYLCSILKLRTDFSRSKEYSFKPSKAASVPRMLHVRSTDLDTQPMRGYCASRSGAQPCSFQPMASA
jgi:hypothetical protein